MKTRYWIIMAFMVGMWPAVLNAGGYSHHGRGGHRSHVFFSFGIGHDSRLGIFFNHHYRPGRHYQGFKHHRYWPHRHYRGFKHYHYHKFKHRSYRSYYGHYKRHTDYRFRHHPRHHHFKPRSFGYNYKIR